MASQQMSDDPTSVVERPELRPMTEQEQIDVRAALARLARGRGVVVRVADLLTSGLGALAGTGLRRVNLPKGLEDRMQGLAIALLTRAHDLAVIGLTRPITATEQRRMVAAVLASGAIGGAAGLAGFVPDASLTTLTILRAIASEAINQGEDLRSEATRQACIEVFLLQGEPGSDPQSQLTGSFRPALSSESAFSYHAARLILRGQSLALLIREAAARYGVALSQKLVAQSVPIIGAASGAALNSAFLIHYRDLAHAYFTLRRVARAREQSV